MAEIIIPGPVSRESVLSVVQQLLTAARARDVVRMRELYAPDAIAISPVFGSVRGRDAIVNTWQTLFATFTDTTVSIADVLVDGNRVAVLSTLRATDRAGLFGRPATGGIINYRLVLLFTVEGGLVVRDERIYDSSGVVERLEKARLDKELQTAASVQRALSPRGAHRGRFSESAGDSVPCRAIGGDFFEFIELPSGGSGILLGDVAGKGPAAALLAAMLQGMFAIEAPRTADPATTVSRINARIAMRRLDARYATLVYAVLAADGSLRYSNAGHNPPVLLTARGMRRLFTGGPIVGAFPDAHFESEKLRLAPGDSLVMFSDGVTEARNGASEEFGEERLLTSLQENAAAKPSDLLAAIFSTVHAFCGKVDPSDDITVTVTRFDG
jgi:ketosteroid isomerase-like protein